MTWKSITLDGFIPFTHCGNSHVSIDFVSPATAFLGTNGCGKSSLLRAMTPYPATRTDYLKGGKIVKVLEHNGHTFELTSDFSKGEGPHSFIMDGTELNVSGTTDTQKDLVNEHLDYSQTLEDILAGNVHICSLPKSGRKQLFSAVYPSDLSFVLELHKKVCSQIRAYGNQIKLMQQREGSLTASLIFDDELKKLEAFKEAALDIIDKIDKANLLLESENDRLKANPVFKKELHGFDTFTDIINEFKQYREDFIRQFLHIDKTRHLEGDINKDTLRDKYVEFNNEMKYVTDLKRQTEDMLASIRDEIDKFTKVKTASISDKKTEINNEIEVIKTEMKSIQDDDNAWLNTPSIPMIKLVDVVEKLEKIQTLITELHDYAGSLLGGDQIQELRQKNNNLRYSIQSLKNEREIHTAQLDQSETRKKALERNSFPQDCIRVCGLRETLVSSLKDVTLRIGQLQARITEINTQIEQNQKEIKENEQKLDESAPAIPLMKDLWDLLTENYLNEIALKGEPYVECLNTHASEIYNRIVRAVDSSKKYYRYKELNDKLEQLSKTLTMMESVEDAQLSLSVIEGLIQDKEKQLENGIAKLADIEIKLEEAERKMVQVGEVGYSLERINKLVEQATDVLNVKILENRIEFNNAMISEHLKMKKNLSEKLMEIEHTLQEQTRISNILGTEIKPTLEGLRLQKMKWECVEKGLSPTVGLPCIYLTRFINRLIALTNNFIKEVWCYDMELVYIQESEELDFTISVLINKSTTVKDINLCSKGQAGIIDLAFTLAMCMERGWLKTRSLMADEIDAAMSDEHRTRLVQMLANLIETEEIKQMFLVNHYAIQTGFTNCDCVVLSPEGLVLPGVYNQHAEIR